MEQVCIAPNALTPVELLNANRGEEAEAQTGTTGDRGRVCARACQSVRVCGVFGERSGHTVKLSSKTTPSPRQPKAQEKVGSFPLSLVKFTLRCSL